MNNNNANKVLSSHWVDGLLTRLTGKYGANTLLLTLLFFAAVIQAAPLSDGEISTLNQLKEKDSVVNLITEIPTPYKKILTESEEHKKLKAYIRLKPSDTKERKELAVAMLNGDILVDPLTGEVETSLKRSAFSELPSPGTSVLKTELKQTKSTAPQTRNSFQSILKDTIKSNEVLYESVKTAQAFLMPINKSRENLMEFYRPIGSSHDTKNHPSILDDLQKQKTQNQYMKSDNWFEGTWLDKLITFVTSWKGIVAFIVVLVAYLSLSVLLNRDRI